MFKLKNKVLLQRTKQEKILKSTLIKCLILSSCFNFSSYAWNIFSRAPKVPLHAVSETDIHTAKCTDTSFSNKKSDQYFAEYFDNLKNNQFSKLIRLGDKQYKNQSEEMAEVYQQLTNFKSLRKNAYCETVACELESIFGASYAHKLTYLLKEFKFNASYIANDNGGSFSESDLDTIIWALDQLPRFVFEEKKKKMIKDTKVYTGFYANVVGFMENATGNMTLFRKWAHSSEEIKAYTVIHEYGHRLGLKLSIDNRKDWMKLSNWHKHDSEDTNNAENLISKYAKSNHIEDFAEAFSAYRFNPKLLKERAPQKYEMIKEIVFLGKEYLTDNCDSQIEKETFSIENLDDTSIVKKCEFPILSYKLGLKKKHVAKNCLIENQDEIGLKEFNVPSGKFSSKVQENYKLLGYPYISEQLKLEYIDHLLDTIN